MYFQRIEDLRVDNDKTQIEIFGDLDLCLIVVNSKVFQPLEIHEITSDLCYHSVTFPRESSPIRLHIMHVSIQQFLPFGKEENAACGRQDHTAPDCAARAALRAPKLPM